MNWWLTTALGLDLFLQMSNFVVVICYILIFNDFPISPMYERFPMYQSVSNKMTTDNQVNYFAYSLTGTTFILYIVAEI